MSIFDLFYISMYYLYIYRRSFLNIYHRSFLNIYHRSFLNIYHRSILNIYHRSIIYIYVLSIYYIYLSLEEDNEEEDFVEVNILKGADWESVNYQVRNVSKNYFVCQLISINYPLKAYLFG